MTRDALVRRPLLGAALALLLLIAPASRTRAQALPADVPFVAPAEARLRADVTYLAADERGGRGVGTSGIDDAADYIANVFRELGLKPTADADGYFQEFSIRGEAALVQPTTLELELPDGDPITGELDATFSPLAIGAAGKLEDAPLVFAGFGITAKDGGAKIDYDDYKDLDVKDKVVLILRRDPEPADKSHPFAANAQTTYATFSHKVVNAAEHGAKAVLLVNDAPSAGERDRLLDYRATPSGGTIPFAMIQRQTADKLLATAGSPPVAELESRINETLEPQSRELPGVKVNLEVTVSREPIIAKNVIGVLEGQGPLADETIVVGAHYDHLGTGGPGSLAFGSREIHNGADDNASGTSTVLELARRLAARPDALPRTVVFMLYSGEERGLLGSAHYVNNPSIPLDKTVTMINYDMVGRLSDSRGLVVYGAGSSDGFEPLVQALSSSLGLEPKFFRGSSGEFNQSDHASFYRKDIPVLFFFTGTHADYHRPGDDTEKINFEGMTRIADLGELLLLDLARRPARPIFIKMSAPAPTAVAARPLRGSGAYLGTRPAYGENVEGVKLEGVTDDSPAQKAGIRGGDILIKFGGVKISDIETYMTALSAKKPGDEVEIVVNRDGKEVTLKAVLGTRPSARPVD
jgi:hypothetical protein